MTLNLDLRWEMDTPRVSPEDQSSGFEMEKIHPIAGVPGVATFAGVGGEPRHLYDCDYNNFGPRFGFAWRPFGQHTVVRGGYGIYFGNRNDCGDADSRQGGSSSGTLGFSTTELRVSLDQSQTPAVWLRDGFPPFAPAGPEIRNDEFGIDSQVDFWGRDRGTPYSQQFNSASSTRSSRS